MTNINASRVKLWQDDDISVPITVDDVKRRNNFNSARCTYFTVESEAPSPDWVLGFAGQGIPLIVTGLSGIIWRPSLDELLFRTSEQIESLFDLIEQDQRLYVGTADVWIPNAVLEHVSRGEHAEPERGLTFRVGYRFFIAAMNFRLDRLAQGEFEHLAGELRDTATFDLEENAAFSRWRQDQVELARRAYPKNGDLALTWTEGPGSSGTEEVHT